MSSSFPYFLISRFLSAEAWLYASQLPEKTTLVSGVSPLTYVSMQQKKRMAVNDRNFIRHLSGFFVAGAEKQLSQIDSESGSLYVHLYLTRTTRPDGTFRRVLSFAKREFGIEDRHFRGGDPIGATGGAAGPGREGSVRVLRQSLRVATQAGSACAG